MTMTAGVLLSLIALALTVAGMLLAIGKLVRRVEESGEASSRLGGRMDALASKLDGLITLPTSLQHLEREVGELRAQLARLTPRLGEIVALRERLRAVERELRGRRGREPEERDSDPDLEPAIALPDR